MHTLPYSYGPCQLYEAYVPLRAELRIEESTGIASVPFVITTFKILTLWIGSFITGHFRVRRTINCYISSGMDLFNPHDGSSLPLHYII